MTTRPRTLRVVTAAILASVLVQQLFCAFVLWHMVHEAGRRFDFEVFEWTAFGLTQHGCSGANHCIAFVLDPLRSFAFQVATVLGFIGVVLPRRITRPAVATGAQVSGTTPYRTAAESPPDGERTARASATAAAVACAAAALIALEGLTSQMTVVFCGPRVTFHGESILMTLIAFGVVAGVREKLGGGIGQPSSRRIE